MRTLLFLLICFIFAFSLGCEVEPSEPQSQAEESKENKGLSLVTDEECELNAETEDSELSNQEPETAASFEDNKTAEVKKPEHDEDVIKPLSETRKQEIIEMKSDSFYRYHYLDHLGWTKDELIEKYGEPTEKHVYTGWTHSGLTERELVYMDQEINFFLYGDEALLGGIVLSGNNSFMGVRADMTLDQIEEVLGKADLYDTCPTEGADLRSYFFGERPDNESAIDIRLGGMADLIISFRATSHDEPNEGIYIRWYRLINYLRQN